METSEEIRTQLNMTTTTVASTVLYSSTKLLIPD